MDFLLDDLDTDGALREAGENAGISRAGFLGATVAGAVAAFAIAPTAEAARRRGRRRAELRLVLEYLQSTSTPRPSAQDAAGRPPRSDRRGARARARGASRASWGATRSTPSFNFRGATEARTRSARPPWPSRTSPSRRTRARRRACAPSRCSRRPSPSTPSRPATPPGSATCSASSRRSARSTSPVQAGGPASGQRDAVRTSAARAPRRGGPSTRGEGARAGPAGPRRPRGRGDRRRGRRLRGGRARLLVLAARPCPRDPGPGGPARGVPDPRPEPLRTAGETRWATVERPVAARTRAAGGRRIARLSSRTPEGTQNLVVVLGRTRKAGGALWVRVRLPVLPNNTTGWVPRASLGGYHTVDTRLVVDRRRLTAELFRAGRRIFRARVGVGQDRWPTPAGRFYVRKADALQEPRLRPARLRDERPLGRPHRLARGRLRRHPRHGPAGAAPWARLAWLHPDAQRRHPAPRRAHAGRDAGDDPLMPPRAARPRRACACVTTASRSGRMPRQGRDVVIASWATAMIGDASGIASRDRDRRAARERRHAGAIVVAALNMSAPSSTSRRSTGSTCSSSAIRKRARPRRRCAARSTRRHRRGRRLAASRCRGRRH